MRLFGILLTLLFGVSAAAHAAGPEDPHRISSARFSCEGEWFVVRIDTAAPWAHWTLANPARIIVDLGDAVTEMPNAPGLYEIEMPEGPIRRLRTSQFMNTALDRRVRFTFELDKIAVYEARRVGSYIEVRIADRERAPRSWELTPAGFREVSATTRATASTTATASTNAVATAPANVAATTPADPSANVTPTAPATGPVSSSVSTPMRLRDALAAAFDTAKTQGSTVSIAHGTESSSKGSRTPQDASREAPAAKNEPGDVAAKSATPASSASAASDTAQDERPAKSARQSDTVDGSDSADASPTKSARLDDEALDEARISLEQLLGAENVNHVREVHGKTVEEDFISRADLLLDPIPDSLGSIVEDDYALDQPAEPSEVVRERAARRILVQAVEAWTAGQAARALSLCERVRRHYAPYPSAQQSLVLEREIHLAQGDRALAASLPAYPVVPDSGVIPLQGFLRFLEEHWKREQVDQIERLAETWGAFYPGGSWLERTRFALGEHYYRNRDLPRAEQYLASIAHEDSLGPRALAMRARLRDEAGDKEGALALYEMLATLEPGPYQLRGLARTADLQFQSGEVDSALAVYRVIESSAPDPTETPWAMFQIGNCHTLLGDPRSAARAYEKVIADFPTSYWAEAARSQLQSLEWQKDLARQVEGMRGR